MAEQSGPTAILLAAGAARRLASELGELPKCLADVGGRPIIDYQIEPLATAHLVVVVGYRAGFLKNELRKLYPGASFRFVENSDYAETNTIWSLYLAREFLARGALLFNADVVLHPEAIERLLEADGTRSWLTVTRAACAQEEVKVIADAAGRITRIGKALDPAECLGEFIGAARFSAPCGARYARELERIAADNQGAFFEYALDRILDEEDVRALDVTDLPCIEIDFPEDLERARAVIAPRIAGSRNRD